jgi:hypothetical protein
MCWPSAQIRGHVDAARLVDAVGIQIPARADGSGAACHGAVERLRIACREAVGPARLHGRTRIASGRDRAVDDDTDFVCGRRELLDDGSPCSRLGIDDRRLLLRVRDELPWEGALVPLWIEELQVVVVRCPAELDHENV